MIILVKHILEKGCNGGSESELSESFNEFPYFAPVSLELNVAEWETEIHRESEELRSLEDTEDPDNWEQDEDSLHG